MEWKPSLLLACALVYSSHAARSSPPAQPSPGSEGQVVVYLQPLPPEAEKLTFSVGAVSLMDDLGNELPLGLSLATLRPADGMRQRLLASGRVPAGTYSGLSILVPKASIKGRGGEAALLVPDTPVKVVASVLVQRARTLVIWLSVDFGASLAGDATFNPVFSAHVPPRPMSSLAGFVSSPRSNAVTVFDKRLRQAVAVIPTCDAPSGMALDQRAARLYVACSRDDELQVIDVVSAEIVERARLLPGDDPREVAMTPDGRTLLSANAGSDSVGLFDASPLRRLDRIEVGSGPGSIAIDPSGRRAFVFNTLSSTISVIDIPRRAVVSTISTETAPLRGQFSARGDRLLVIHERSPYLSVLDPEQSTIVNRARLRLGLSAMKLDSRRGLLYLGGPDDRMVEFYDPNTLLPIGSVKTRGGVSHLALDAEDNSLYMVSPGRKSLEIASLADRRVVSEIDVGEGPYWVAVMGEK
jgi:YVTN family beta-propeller protein